MDCSFISCSQDQDPPLSLKLSKSNAVICLLTQYEIGIEFVIYRFNDNTMRGAAKSLAPLPTAWMDNITGKTEVLADSLDPNTFPAIEAFFEFPHS